jgi:hypothetical protein
VKDRKNSNWKVRSLSSPRQGSLVHSRRQLLSHGRSGFSNFVVTTVPDDSRSHVGGAKTENDFN